MANSQEWQWVSEVRMKVMEVLKDRDDDCDDVIFYLGEIPVTSGSHWHTLRAKLKDDAGFRRFVEKLVKKCKELEKEKDRASKEIAGEHVIGKGSGKSDKENDDQVKQVTRNHNGNDGNMASLANIGTRFLTAAAYIFPHVLKVMNGEISKSQCAVNALRDIMQPGTQPFGGPATFEVNLTQINLYVINGHPYSRASP